MPAPSVTLEQLLACHREAAKRFKLPDYLPGLGALGLMPATRPDGCRYDWCTPGNCISFAGTGGNGVHFSLLRPKTGKGSRRPTGDTPVVMTNPANSGQNLIVGENLYDFLCLGYYRGFFALEQLSYDLKLTLRVFTQPDWQPTERRHESVGYTLDDEQRPVLQRLIETFDLRPWSSADRFETLQKSYAALLGPPLEELD